MSQMKPSATLQAVFDAIDVSRTSPVLNNMLVGALASRELIGLSRYGMTLDGQPGRDPFFWLIIPGVIAPAVQRASTSSGQRAVTSRSTSSCSGASTR